MSWTGSLTRRASAIERAVSCRLRQRSGESLALSVRARAESVLAAAERSEETIAAVGNATNDADKIPWRAPMPKKKARPQRPAAATAPAPAHDDDDGLIDDLLAQLDSRQTSDPSQVSSPHRSDPAPPKQSAKSRFLARQARRAAAIAQASPQVDPATQERLQLEINQEEEAIRRTCDQLGLDVFHARILFLRWGLAHISHTDQPRWPLPLFCCSGPAITVGHHFKVSVRPYLRPPRSSRLYPVTSR